LYAVESGPLQEIDVWLGRFRGFWNQHLDALATELARGKRERRRAAAPPPDNPSQGNPSIDKKDTT
jgi:hypothetical protein